MIVPGICQIFQFCELCCPNDLGLDLNSCLCYLSGVFNKSLELYEFFGEVFENPTSKSVSCDSLNLRLELNITFS